MVVLYYSSMVMLDEMVYSTSKKDLLYALRMGELVVQFHKVAELRRCEFSMGLDRLEPLALLR